MSTGRDGTEVVRVAAELSDGRPASVYAEHTGDVALAIAAGVTLVEDEAFSFSRDLVEVRSDDSGRVHIAPAGSATLP